MYRSGKEMLFEVTVRRLSRNSSQKIKRFQTAHCINFEPIHFGMVPSEASWNSSYLLYSLRPHGWLSGWISATLSIQNATKVKYNIFRNYIFVYEKNSRNGSHRFTFSSRSEFSRQSSRTFGSYPGCLKDTRLRFGTENRSISMMTSFPCTGRSPFWKPRLSP